MLEDLRDQEHRLCKPAFQIRVYATVMAVLEKVRNNQIPTHSFLQSQVTLAHQESEQ